MEQQYFTLAGDKPNELEIGFGLGSLRITVANGFIEVIVTTEDGNTIQNLSKTLGDAGWIFNIAPSNDIIEGQVIRPQLTTETQ